MFYIAYGNTIRAWRVKNSPIFVLIAILYKLHKMYQLFTHSRFLLQLLYVMR